MVSKNFPRRVWEFGLKHATNVIQMIPSSTLNGRMTIESVTGENPDISDYVNTNFYDLVWYHKGRHPKVIKTGSA